MIAIRPVIDTDLPVLATFDEWKTVTPERVAAGHVYVATVDDDPCAIGILDRSFMNRAFIAIIYVHADHRRSGLASALIRHFESITTDRKIWISTNIENLAMQAVLHRHEYAMAGVVNHLGAVPELFYVKTLRDA